MHVLRMFNVTCILLGCPEDVTVWNITWPVTDAGEIAIQKCPGGIESLGTYCRTLFVL